MKKMNLEKYKKLAERYTKAIWKIAEDRNEVEKIGNELNTVADIISQNSDTESFFVNPIIADKDKKEVIETSFKGKIDDDLYKFLNILVDKNRIFLLPNIQYIYSQKIAEKQNILNVEVQTVIELDDELKNLLKTKLEKITNKNINIINIIDKAIIGGVVLKFDGKVIDGSVQTQLKRLQKQLI